MSKELVAVILSSEIEMSRIRCLTITHCLPLLLLVTTAVCQNELYRVETESAKEQTLLFNLLGHVTLKDLIRSTVKDVLSEIEEDHVTSKNFNQQCVRGDELDALRNLIKSDQENIEKLLQLASDQLEELQRTVNSGENSSLYSVESSHPKTLTLVGRNIPPLSMLEDAAYGKHTYCSSVFANGYLNRYANDGDDVSFFVSKHDIGAWWMVDLARERTIYHITILPRQDCCHGRFHDVEIRIGDTLKTNGDFSSHRLLAIYKGHYALDQGTLKFTFYSGIKGRYLSIKITSEAQEYLQINTVQAIALKN